MQSGMITILKSWYGIQCGEIIIISRNGRFALFFFALSLCCSKLLLVFWWSIIESFSSKPRGFFGSGIFPNIKFSLVITFDFFYWTIFNLNCSSSSKSSSSRPSRGPLPVVVSFFGSFCYYETSWIWEWSDPSASAPFLVIPLPVIALLLWAGIIIFNS